MHTGVRRRRAAWRCAVRPHAADGRTDGAALEEYLADVVFRDARGITITSAPEQIEECARSLEVFARVLPVQAAAVAAL